MCSARYTPPTPTRIGDKSFEWGEHTYIMGIVNVTPDSFSGDGLAYNIPAATAQAMRFQEEGADIIDVGGESTRPDAQPVNADEEMRRVIPVIERLAGKLRIPVSVDTYRSAVARRALDAGASMLNDVWGLKQDPALAGLAAERKVPIVLMSNQRSAAVPRIMPAVISDLNRATGIARSAGVPPHNIIVDPGIGFGKTLQQNLELIRRLRELRRLGYPILLGTSRKSMIGLVLGLPPDQRIEGTASTVAIGIANGADIVRVHDVLAMSRVCRMSDAIVRQRRFR
ncbi:MAG: dihydropteroate synthase [Chloroflexi bacterium]|nr:dihydropteroate synthase [Chloroflexota bacterium]